ncbi:hypothetical protein FKP32DRAFT_700865 [Trametes sanguinea]|nr:hypothetical protein FKP32DRAFT_700865 [Trametes sanguinea]
MRFPLTSTRAFLGSDSGQHHDEWVIQGKKVMHHREEIARRLPSTNGLQQSLRYHLLAFALGSASQDDACVDVCQRAICPSSPRTDCRRSRPTVSPRQYAELGHFWSRSATSASACSTVTVACTSGFTVLTGCEHWTEHRQHTSRGAASSVMHQTEARLPRPPSNNPPTHLGFERSSCTHNRRSSMAVGPFAR